VEKCGRAGQATDDNIIWCMRFVYWINKSADTHSEYIIRLLFYGNSGCTNAPQSRIINACLFFGTRILSDIVNFWKTSFKLQLNVYRHCLKLPVFIDTV
jgi:hypothetical protein